MPSVSAEEIKSLHARDQLIAELKRYTLELESRLTGMQARLNATPAAELPPPVVTPVAAAPAVPATPPVAAGPPMLAAPCPSIMLPLGVDEELELAVQGAMPAVPLADIAPERARKVKYSVVNRLKSGQFFVHPREDVVSAAALGPFSGQPPILVLLDIQATHEKGPEIEFHVSVVPVGVDPADVVSRLDGLEGRHAWVAVRPDVGACRVTVWPRMAVAGDTGWSLLLCTRVALGRSINYGWATFSSGLAVWTDQDGALARPLV